MERSAHRDLLPRCLFIVCWTVRRAAHMATYAAYSRTHGVLAPRCHLLRVSHSLHCITRCSLYASVHGVPRDRLRCARDISLRVNCVATGYIGLHRLQIKSTPHLIAYCISRTRLWYSASNWINIILCMHLGLAHQLVGKTLFSGNIMPVKCGGEV